MIQVEDEKMIFLDANAFYSYYGRSKLGMTSEPVDEERLKKYLEQQREKSLPTSVYIEIMTHFRNNPKVLQNLLEFRYAKGLPLFNNIPDYVVSEDEITSVAYMDQAALKNYADRKCVATGIYVVSDVYSENDWKLGWEGNDIKRAVGAVIDMIIESIR